FPRCQTSLPNTHKCWPLGRFVVSELVDFVETLSLGMCGVAVILWMSIGTFSRTLGGEVFAQRAIATLCIISAVMLIILNFLGRELWGSSSIALPMALVAVIVAISASMNLRGKDVQGEKNPHEIMKMRKEER
ncbi:MAG: hypothetical protein L7R66_00960, partial [Candidatus Thalassarchaeaceae archaeon]|nr:hypothetical protein [Candidatus Thalassarchaeaceae archaeon]